MQEYLMLFRNASAENGYLSTTDEMAGDLSKWQSWIGTIAMQGKLVHTAPIEYAGTIVSMSNDVTSPYKGPDSVLVSGYLICKAESLIEVQGWSKTCPILKYPNSSVEIRPITPFNIN